MCLAYGIGSHDKSQNRKLVKSRLPWIGNAHTEIAEGRGADIQYRILQWASAEGFQQ